jgi:hypothetical protein
MKKLLINSEEYHLKSSYSEFTQLEFINVCQLLSQFINKQATAVEYNALRIVAFRILSDVPDRYTNKITASEWVDILPHLDFVFLQEPLLVGQLLPSILVAKERFYGPIGLMAKCTIEEFTLIETAFVKASNGKDAEQLAVMMSYMYRPERTDLTAFRKTAKWNTDIREEFNAERCKSRIEDFNKLPLNLLVANFIYFKSVREQRFKMLKYIFAESSGKIKMDDRGWAGALLDLSHTGVFGNYEDQAKQNWFTVMFELDRLSEQNIKSNPEK